MKLFAILLLLPLLQSCATIASDSDYPVMVESNPNGAAITVTNKEGALVYQGATPILLQLPAEAGYFSGETYTIEASLQGHADATTMLDSSLDGWYWGNILFGGLLGLLIVDPISGDMWKLEESIYINMAPEASPQP